MKYYYKVKNDILLETLDKDKKVIGRKTDEPDWVKELDRDKKINRITTSQDALYTYFVSDDDIPELEKSDLIEIEKVFAMHFPNYYKDKITNVALTSAEVAITKPESYILVATEDQVNVEKEIELKSKRINYNGCGVNWSGSYNGGTMADGDHITGAVTFADAYTWTIPAGATIYVDGAYILTAKGKVTWVGTSASPWIIKSNLAAPLRTSISQILLNSVDTGSAIQYGKIYNCSFGVAFDTNTSSTQLTIDHLLIENCEYGIATGGSLAAGTTNVISNIRIVGCGYAINLANNVNAYIVQVVDSEITDCSVQWIAVANTANKLQLLRCKFSDISSLQVNAFYSILDIDNCLFSRWTYSLNLRNTITSTLDNSLFANFESQHVTFTNSGDGQITTCDFIGNIYTTALGLVTGGGSIINCYIAGGMKYQRTVYEDDADSGTDDNVYTSTTARGMLNTVDNWTGLKSARNETFIPASVAESGLGDNGVTIGWTSGGALIKTKHRIRYGTVAGTYTMEIEPRWDWSNWSGLFTVMTTTPSIALTNLKSGTKYYYVVESWDWAFEVWVTSAEGDFTTTETKPSITNVTIDKTSMTTADNVLVTITATNTPTVYGVRINGIDFEASGSAGTYTVTIKGINIGTGTAMSVVGYASNSSGGSASYTCASTLTITASAYTNQFNIIMGDLRTLLTTEFTDELTVLIGDRVSLSNFPAIVLEPYDKDIQQGITFGKKDYSFRINLWVYDRTNEEEQAVKSLSEISERVEELLIDNVQNPNQDGSKWYQSHIEKVEYGMVNKGAEVLRTCKLTAQFKKRLVK